MVDSAEWILVPTFLTPLTIKMLLVAELMRDPHPVSEQEELTGHVLPS